MRVHEVDVPAALDRAVDVRRALARDEVQIVARLIAAVEAYLLVLLNGEVLPAEDIVRALARDVHDRAARGDVRLGLVRRCVRALDGQSIRRLRGKGRGECAREDGTGDGAIKLLCMMMFHLTHPFCREIFLAFNNVSICTRCLRIFASILIGFAHLGRCVFCRRRRRHRQRSREVRRSFVPYSILR